MSRQQVYEQTTGYFLKEIASLREDEEVSEILINGHDQVYYEKGGMLHLSDIKFADERSLLAAATNIAEYVGRKVDRMNHSMDARLPDGSRVHVLIPPSSRGVCISIRKFRRASFNLENLINWKSITEEVAEFLWFVVRAHKNTVISGGTGSGKTSLLNALSSAIPEYERIIVIEDSAELQLYQPHTVYLEAQAGGDGYETVTIRDLFVDSLRMRPDRIVVGEIRRGEALDLIQSMISGHEGSLTTVHANTPRDATIRLETLSLLSDVSLPLHVARTQVASAVQVVIQIARLGDGSRKVLTISECLGLDDSNEYVLKPIYQFKGEGRDDSDKILGQLHWTGYRPTFTDQLYETGLDAEIKLTKNVFSPSSPLSEQ